MNRYHNLISNRTRTQGGEPRWVTQCLDGFNVNERKIETKKKNENSFSKLLNSLIPRRERNSKPVGKERGSVPGDGELKRASDEIYNDILQTVQLQAPPRPRKGIIKGKSR